MKLPLASLFALCYNNPRVIIVSAAKDRQILQVLDALGAPNHSDLATRTERLLKTLGVWEVAHRIRAVLTEHPNEAQAFLQYLGHTHPAAADRIQILLTATKGEDKELLKREFGGD
ncbi:MAG: hypothetical protein N3E42_00540 [Candidatus Bipolaricaulota bacterium]|nr:hypothetical protein [Candidatus Bipolaricaulota bacterium]